MKHKIHSIIGRGVALTSSIIFINSAFADASTDARLQAYKANKLIPAEIQLPTSTNAKDSDEVVVFNASAYVWNNENAINIVKRELNALYGEMTSWGAGDWDLADLYSEEDMGFICRTPTELGYKAIEYFAEALKGRVDTALSSEELQSLNFELFKKFYGNGNGEMGLEALPFHLTGGEDFTGFDFKEQDLSKVTGMTGHQLGQAARIFYTALPEITLDGTEDFSNLEICYSADLTKLKNATYEQVAQMYANTSNVDYVTYPNLEYKADIPVDTLSKLPMRAFSGQIIPYNTCKDAWAEWGYITDPGGVKVSFTGNEDLDSVISSGIYDLSNTVGLTKAQVLNAESLKETILPAMHFDGTENFNSSFWMVDVSKTTGLTGAQIAQSYSINEMKCTAAQYNEWKTELSNAHSGSYIYVDGEFTTIP